MQQRPDDVTTLLLSWRRGEEAALARLIPLVHAELHQIARRCMARERRGPSLQATALVNEAFLRLVDIRRLTWQNRAHFLAVAARLMRRVLVDLARVKRARKRGGSRARITFDESLPVAEGGVCLDVIALDEALHELESSYPRQARGVELRFFSGMSVDEIAGVLDVSPQTVMRDWKFAKAWLLRELGDRSPRPARDGVSSPPR